MIMPLRKLSVAYGDYGQALHVSDSINVRQHALQPHAYF